MSRTRIHNMNISLDGYAAGEHGDVRRPDRRRRAAVQVVRRPGNPWRR